MLFFDPAIWVNNLNENAFSGLTTPMSRALSTIIYFRSKNFEEKVQGTKMGYYSPNLVQINLESFTYKAQSDVINGPETIRSNIFRDYQVKNFQRLSGQKYSETIRLTIFMISVNFCVQLN